MNRKIFTLLLLAVFMLAQFSVSSAAPVAATGTITPLPTFSPRFAMLDIEWSLTGMPGGATQNVLLWHRAQGDPWSDTYCIDLTGNVNNLTAANGTFTFDTYDALPYAYYWDQDIVEFLITVVDAGSCGAVANLPTDEAPMASTFMDTQYPDFFIANPPSLEPIVFPIYFDDLSVACNTFELWGIASDQAFALEGKAPFVPLGYSGFEGWHQSTSGTFAPPAPLGPTYDLLSWMVTFPPTSSGNWVFSVQPSDFAGNQFPFPVYFRNHEINSGPTDELADCADFSDTSGTMYELYVRYMAQLGLGHGYADGSFNPEGTLSRGEMAAFIELANGYIDETIPTAPPSAECTFTDVSGADWFAGWVWQACADGFMIGVGGGLFDPNNFLTRGQVVTVLDNLSLFPAPPRDSYLNTPNNIFTTEWGNIYREAAWTDVNIGDFFANGVIHSYGVGVSDGTSETTFSPNQAILRGEFMKMMYRALSRIDPCSKCD